MSSSNITPTSRSLFLDPGPLRPLVEEFGRCLASQGHTVLTVRGYEDAARHFAVWFQQTGIAVADIGEDTCVAFAAHRCRCPGGRRATVFLRSMRVVLGVLSSSCRRPGRLARRRRLSRRPWTFAWDCSRNGCVSTAEYAERTISRYGRMVMRLLAALGADPAAIHGRLIRQAVLDEVKDMSAAHAKTMTTALRGYLRFLGASAHAVRTSCMPCQPSRNGGCPQCRAISRG